ncbi:chorismate mutase [Sphingomonas flavalba]|uniref:chorismate mutase n=1 Tax=Sphingomonas flavalba TaxID=2559804 RepID=UPI00109DA8A6|nr:chorismate mutase [Sphingomonas flavalba]
MDETVKAPEDCATMLEVRAGVDAVDRALMRLIATRFGYMDAAARIKPERSAVRDEPRKAQVIANARRSAAAAGVPEDVAAGLWDWLVEASIAYEFEVFDRKR